MTNMDMLCHDPRLSSDPEEKVLTENPALQLAEYARMAFPGREVFWPKVAELADFCDEPVEHLEPPVNLMAEFVELMARDAQIRVKVNGEWIS